MSDPMSALRANSDASGHAGNNFDAVRFVAATGVLFSHCCALAAHDGEEPLVSACIFLFACPIQQFVAWLGGPEEALAMFALAFPATLALAVLSWHFVERPCRDLKRLVRPRASSEADVPAANPGFQVVAQ